MGELTIGFVGLGNMGRPMAANLHAAGFPLVVRDATADRQLAFSGAHPGAVAADQPGAFAVADIVVTMLPDGAVVADALLNWGIAAARGPRRARPGRRPVEGASGVGADRLSEQ
jgi:3-hydroxyisobutyrate dehydrogenase